MVPRDLRQRPVKEVDLLEQCGLSAILHVLFGAELEVVYLAL
jgi:hypothetical protein